MSLFLYENKEHATHVYRQRKTKHTCSFMKILWRYSGFSKNPFWLQCERSNLSKRSDVHELVKRANVISFMNVSIPNNF